MGKHDLAQLIGGPLRVLTAALVLCLTSAATPIGFGIVSYDILVPQSGQQLGVNVINIQNLTGGSSLAPGSRVAAPLQFASNTIIQSLTFTTVAVLNTLSLRGKCEISGVGFGVDPNVSLGIHCCATDRRLVEGEKPRLASVSTWRKLLIFLNRRREA